MFDQDLLKDIDLRKGECRLHKCGLSIDNPGDNLLLRPLCSDDYEKGKCCFCHDSKVLFSQCKIWFVLQKNLSTGSHFQCNDFFHPPKFTELLPKFRDAVENMTRCEQGCRNKITKFSNFLQLPVRTGSKSEFMHLSVLCPVLSSPPAQPEFHPIQQFSPLSKIVTSVLAEVSHNEAKIRGRRETRSPSSHFCLVVRDLCQQGTSLLRELQRLEVIR